MRVIFDTNIWSEIGRRDSRQLIERLSDDRGWTILTPPAVLLEVLRTTDDVALRSIIEALSSKQWVRLKTEADQESQEFVAEARRLRPNWVRDLPQPGKLAHYRNYWQKTVWRQARSDPIAARAATHVVHDPANQLAYEVHKYNRDARLATGQDVSDLRSIRVEPEDWSATDRVAGWTKGQRIEWWRVQARDTFWRELRSASTVRMSGRNSTYTDWTEPYLRVSSVLRNAEDFTRFWFDEVDEVSAIRSWLRWAVQTAQMMGQVTPSSPRDEQLAAYLPDCDIFVSADRRLTRALAIVDRSSLIQLPKVITLPRLNADDSIVAVLGDIVEL